MFSLTHQERKVLLVIAATICAGSILRANGKFRTQEALPVVHEEKNFCIININTASLQELQTLPGIGPVLAARIVEQRSQEGSFQDLESLKTIHGIGEKTLHRLKSHIAF